jgi:murein L,D-transpeptidase YcbB/YkuD
VQDADRLAAELVKLDSGSDAAVAQGLKSYRTQTLKLREARPVWLVYFTLDVGPDGTLELLEDPYNRDTKLIAQLEKPVRMAMR